MNTPLHPISGFHYVVVIPDVWGAYVDYADGYTELAKVSPWLTVLTPDAFHALYPYLYGDPNVFVVLWTDEVAPRPRKALVAALYTEAIGEPTDMLPDHLRHWRDFGAHAPDYDAVLVHVPGMIEPLRRGMNLPTFLFPAGWSPSWGSPRWGPKDDHLLYWGSTVGRRKSLIPWMKVAAPPRLHDASGQFGRSILAEIERSRAAVYIAHSRVLSISTWRLWQMLTTSTALIAEPGDAWPFEPGKHFLSIPYLDDDFMTIDPGHAAIREFYNDKGLLDATARRAHADLAEKFTIARCIEDYLVPASLELNARRT